MKGGNRSDFISQVDQLIAVRHGGEPERDEGGRKRCGSTGAHFRVRRLRQMAASQPTISGCCGVCAGKTQVSKITAER